MTLDDPVDHDGQYAHKVQCIERHFKRDFPGSYLGLHLHPSTEDVEVTVEVDGTRRRVCFSSVFIDRSPHEQFCKMLASGRIADLVREGRSEEYFVWAGGIEDAAGEMPLEPGEKP